MKSQIPRTHYRPDNISREQVPILNISDKYMYRIKQMNGVVTITPGISVVQVPIPGVTTHFKLNLQSVDSKVGERTGKFWRNLEAVTQVDLLLSSGEWITVYEGQKPEASQAQGVA